MSDTTNQPLQQFNKLETFSKLSAIKRSGVDDVSKALNQSKEKLTGSEIFSAIDTAGGKSEKWLNQVAESFSIERFGEIRQDVVEKFRAYTGEEKEAMKANLEKFAFDATNVIDTTVFPALEGLVRQSPVLSMCRIITETEFKQLLDWDVEKDAENLAKAATGSRADDALRKSVLLNNKDKKVQASTSIHERDLMNLDATEIGIFLARIQRRIEYKLVNNVLYSDGTSNNFTRGIINSVGGVADANNHLGSLEVTLTGGVADDHVDALEYVDGQLSKFITDQEELAYAILMNRSSISKVRRTKEAVSGLRYFQPSDTLEINGKRVVNVPNMNADQFLFFHKGQYWIIVADNMSLINDQGILQFLEGYITYKATTYADGAPRMAFKYTEGKTLTDAGGGVPTEAFDNADQNYWRHGSLQSSYA